jgi:SynChlorMet cassette radical SAM/SPASM protein ScmE
MGTPRSLDLSITHQCNLRCKYCSHFTSAGDVNKDLPAEQWLRFFEELNRCKVMNVCLQGGEPFCRNDLPELIEGIVRNKMRFSILTNGTLITDDMAAFLSSTHRCDSVQVSIDGSNAQTHDICRGHGTFQKAVAGIDCLIKRNINVTVRVTIHKYNIDDLGAIAHLLLEDIGLPSFSTNSASFMGLCRENTEEVQLTATERASAMKTLLMLNKKYNGRIEATAGPLAEAITWITMDRSRRDNKEEVSEAGFLTGCNGPMSNIAVRADGIIVPCIQLSHIELGRIDRNDLKEIWLNHPELQKLRNRQSIALAGFAFCSDCDYVDYCTGNCPALAYTILGDTNHPSPDACLRKFLQDGGILPDQELAGLS